MLFDSFGGDTCPPPPLGGKFPPDPCNELQWKFASYVTARFELGSRRLLKILLYRYQDTGNDKNEILDKKKLYLVSPLQGWGIIL